MLKPEIQAAYVSILKEELVPATGCTEPIAMAYCAAKLKETLGALPERVVAEVSGNILKNVKSVVVPNTGGLKGIRAAIAAGLIAGAPDRELEVISSVPKSLHGQIAAYIQQTPIEIVCPETPRMLDIRLNGFTGAHKAVVHIANNHCNIVYIERDGTILLEKPLESSSEAGLTDKSLLNLEDILTFANEVDLALVSPLLERQVSYNSAIAEEGLTHSWGTNIGSTLLKAYGGDIKVEASAWAAAGSDARMSGCELPVVINSGSGNQGITSSLPVVRYAKYLGATEEKLYRALLVSDLVTIYQKAGIGRLSAYCGAVSAGVGAGAGIAYLQGADYDAVSHTIVNAVAILSGTICDGAKPSCAAKIAASVNAGILGYEMYLDGHNFQSGDGIIGNDVSETVTNVGILAQEGMRATDRTILRIMTQDSSAVHCHV
ncbi:MAG: serine dehydratase subunit alpha family protein [Lachnospiraceae bacterium]|nr:serine dehydratase subunit alpha family protein [Lachnospiraceae bacterium]